MSLLKIWVWPPWLDTGTPVRTILASFNASSFPVSRNSAPKRNLDESFSSNRNRKQPSRRSSGSLLPGFTGSESINYFWLKFRESATVPRPSSSMIDRPAANRWARSSSRLIRGRRSALMATPLVPAVACSRVGGGPNDSRIRRSDGRWSPGSHQRCHSMRSNSE